MIDCSYTLNFQALTNFSLLVNLSSTIFSKSSLLVNRRKRKPQLSRGQSFLVMHTRARRITFLRDNTLGELKPEQRERNVAFLR